MASRNNDSGGGCLAGIIAFFIFIFLPAWVTGDDFGWGVLFVWWLILGLVIMLVVYAGKPDTTKKESIQKSQPQHTDIALKDDSYARLTVSNENKHLSLMERYKNKKNKIDICLRKRKELEEEVNQLSAQIEQLEREYKGIVSFDSKPFFISKKKYLEKKEKDIEGIKKDAQEKIEKKREIQKNVLDISSEIDSMSLKMTYEKNNAFDKLVLAFDNFKKAEHIDGNPNTKNWTIPTDVKCEDLKFVKYNQMPYGINMLNYRFYIFPNEIFVYEQKGELLGIYKPSSIHCIFTPNEKTYYGWGEKSIYSDTKIVRERTTWQHTCKDGSIDLRYRDNRRIEVTTYVECNIDLMLCGASVRYKVSSYDKSLELFNAIREYSKVKESIDSVPMLIDLLRRCDISENMEQIREMLVNI